MNRLHGFLASGLVLTALPSAAFDRFVFSPPREPVVRFALELTPEAREVLAARLRQSHAKYDPGERMLRRPFSSPGYHTTLKDGTVHPTRDSLHYAALLLDSGETRWIGRAEAILVRVIGLQDQDWKSRTYGIWSWFLEEPLEKMSPPDWNWADFNGVTLLHVALYHRDRIDPAVMRLVDESIQHAVRSIRRRNVGPGYTNISIMGTYATLMASELYGLDDLEAYALKRLARIEEHTRKNGTFSEYNSPTYTIVALDELGRMRAHVRVPEARKTIDYLYRVAWEEIAQHFHPPTRQWAGPHSRCYRTLLRPGYLGVIQHGLGSKVDFGVKSNEARYNPFPLPCPPDLVSHFTGLGRPRHLVKTFIQSTPPVVGTTHLDPKFTIGSINRGDCWNQRRPLLAYWGSHGNPSAFRVQLLHDRYDFSAGQFFAAQDGGSVLAGINFATDGGDTHVSLDRLKDGTFTAQDLRLRFLFEGAAGGEDYSPPAALTEPKALTFGDVQLRLQVLAARFGDQEGRWESGRGSRGSWLDVVLYHGPRKEFRLPGISPAALGFSVEMSTGVPPGPKSEASWSDNHLQLTLNDLELTLPVIPGTRAKLQKAFRSEVK